MLSADLKRIRCTRNFTLKDVSRATGLSIPTIWRAENGRNLFARTEHKLEKFTMKWRALGKGRVPSR